MEAKDLKKVLDEIPILLVDACFINHLSINDDVVAGMAIQKRRPNGSILKYTVMNENCDDLVYTLLHESLHHHYKKATSEEFIGYLTNHYWGDIQQRKLCQNKIVELCEEYNL